MDTNKQLLTVDDLFRLQGRQPGWSPTDMEYEQAIKTVEALNKEKLSAMMMPEQQQPKYISLTNEADNSVVRGIMEQGKFREIPADRIATPQGTFTMMSPTNAAPVYLPDGSVAQNYTSQTLLGEDEAALGTYSPGQTAAPAQAPAPTPMPSAAPSPTPNQQAPQQAQFVRVVSPDGKTGIIPAGQVDQAIKQGFRLAP